MFGSTNIFKVYAYPLHVIKNIIGKNYAGKNLMQNFILRKPDY